jgi:hypothetical protein
MSYLTFETLIVCTALNAAVTRYINFEILPRFTIQQGQNLLIWYVLLY